LRPSTRARDLGYLEPYILPHFGDMRLGSIDHMAVREWITQLTTRTQPKVLAPAAVVKAGQI
jgi:hypothetical protein